LTENVPEPISDENQAHKERVAEALNRAINRARAKKCGVGVARNGEAKELYIFVSPVIPQDCMLNFRSTTAAKMYIAQYN